MSYPGATAPYPTQQQVLVVHNPPAQPPTTRVYDHYKAGHSRALGITQILLGCLAILFNAVGMYLETDSWGLSYSGLGIWSGLWVSNVD